MGFLTGDRFEIKRQKYLNGVELVLRLSSPSPAVIIFLVISDAFFSSPSSPFYPTPLFLFHTLDLQHFYTHLTISEDEFLVQDVPSNGSEESYFSRQSFLVRSASLGTSFTSLSRLSLHSYSISNLTLQFPTSFTSFLDSIANPSSTNLSNLFGR